MNQPLFTPVPVRPRHDGWTLHRQKAFIHALAETACVEEACRRVGISAQSAYALRRRPDASLFRDAWEAALDYGYHRLEEAALKRAVEGVPRPIFYHGEQVGEWRDFDERLTLWLLRYRRPRRFGAWRDQAGPPQHPHEDEETQRLDWLLNEFEEQILIEEEVAEPDEKNSSDPNDA
jgi:hypothetical protein